MEKSGRKRPWKILCSNSCGKWGKDGGVGASVCKQRDWMVWSTDWGNPGTGSGISQKIKNLPAFSGSQCIISYDTVMPKSVNGCHQ